MTLKEDEKTLSLLHECIDFPILASPENVITGRLEFILAQIVPPGVRDTKALRRSGGQKVPTNPQALENSESLLRKAATPDTVHVKDRRMRGEAGPDSGRRILRSPIEEPCQFRPVGFILEIRRTRLCACHDEAIGRAAPEFVNAPVRTHLAPSHARSWNSRQRVTRQTHDDVAARGLIQERDELTFRRFERRIRHIVDQTNIEQSHDHFVTEASA